MLEKGKELPFARMMMEQSCVFGNVDDNGTCSDDQGEDGNKDGEGITVCSISSRFFPFCEAKRCLVLQSVPDRPVTDTQYAAGGLSIQFPYIREAVWLVYPG